MGWLNYYAPAIQAISAVAIVLLTIFLALFAGRSLMRTEEALSLSQEQLSEQRKSLGLLEKQIEEQKNALNLAREEFEREWQPQVRLFVDLPRNQEVRLRVANLGRTALLVQSIEIGVGIGTEISPYPIQWVEIVGVNECKDSNLYSPLLSAIGRLTRASGSTINHVGNMAVRIRYFSAGQLSWSDGFSFGIRIRANLVDEITPIE